MKLERGEIAIVVVQFVALVAVVLLLSSFTPGQSAQSSPVVWFGVSGSRELRNLAARRSTCEGDRERERHHRGLHGGVLDEGLRGVRLPPSASARTRPQGSRPRTPRSRSAPRQVAGALPDRRNRSDGYAPTPSRCTDSLSQTTTWLASVELINSTDLSSSHLDPALGARRLLEEEPYPVLRAPLAVEVQAGRTSPRWRPESPPISFPHLKQNPLSTTPCPTEIGGCDLSGMREVASVADRIKGRSGRATRPMEPRACRRRYAPLQRLLRLWTCQRARAQDPQFRRGGLGCGEVDAKTLPPRVRRVPQRRHHLDNPRLPQQLDRRVFADGRGGS